MHNHQRPHIVIIGAGFGGLRAARALAKAPVRVTLIDRNNYHLFQPLLYQVATAGLSSDEIAYPIRGIFHRQKNVQFLLTEVIAVDFDKNFVISSKGTIPFDILILAPGNQTKVKTGQSNLLIYRKLWEGHKPQQGIRKGIRNQ